MPATPYPRIPSYRLHKTSGRAVVRLNGRDIYLGVHGTPESRAKYERVIAEWLAHNRQLPDEVQPRRNPCSLILSQLLLSYLQHAKAYYVKNERPTRE